MWGCLGFDLKCVVAFWRLGSSLGDYVEMTLFLHRDLVGVAAEEKQMQRREERKGEGGNEKEKVREGEREESKPVMRETMHSGPLGSRI